jgi:hypothetical protein
MTTPCVRRASSDNAIVGYDDMTWPDVSFLTCKQSASPRHFESSTRAFSRPDDLVVTPVARCGAVVRPGPTTCRVAASGCLLPTLAAGSKAHDKVKKGLFRSSAQDKEILFITWLSSGVHLFPWHKPDTILTRDAGEWPALLIRPIWSTIVCCIAAAAPQELLGSSRPFHTIGEEEDVKRMPCAFTVIVRMPQAGGERRSCNGHTLLGRLNETLLDGTVYPCKKEPASNSNQCADDGTQPVIRLQRLPLTNGVDAMRAKMMLRENRQHQTAIQNEGVPRQVP